MKRLLIHMVLSATLLFALPLFAHAATVGEALSPAEVVVLSRGMDGSVIVVEGEAVGDVLRTVGGGHWVNVLGDEVGLGIWMDDEEMLEKITHLGSYKQNGDIIRVRGTVNMTCAQHGGEFDLHAESVEVLSQGHPRTHAPRLELGLVGLAGIIIGGGLWLRYRALRD